MFIRYSKDALLLVVETGQPAVLLLLLSCWPFDMHGMGGM